MQKILILLTGLLFAHSAQAAPDAPPDTRPDTQVALVASAPGGRTVQLAFRMVPRAGWHLYWSNYGDVGAPTEISFRGWPPGTKVAAWRYPTPERLVFGEVTNYGYEKPITLLTTVTLPPKYAMPGQAMPASVEATANWLACTTQVCVPETRTLKLALPGVLDAAQRAVFIAGQAALPLTPGWPARAHRAAGLVQIEVTSALPLESLEQVEYFPASADVIDHAAAQTVVRDGAKLWLETRAAAQPNAATPANGVLVLTGADGTRTGYDIAPAWSPAPLVPPQTAITVGTISAPSAAASALPALPWALALLFAVGGGLLLNLMPCVFPILALKAFALARAGDTDGTAQREAVAYTAGVMLTFALVGGALLALRSTGAAVGWGFQLQDPRIVAGLGLLMVLVALNLAGLFDVSFGSGGLGDRLAASGGAAGAFWTGALAVVVATPCTAPFMAGALGAALVLPPAAGLGIFLGLGLGLALPFLLLGFVPAARRWLPRPGAWMVRFKQFLAFPMLATALWLFWVVGQLTSTTTMAMVIAAGLLLALAVWLRTPGTRLATAMALLAGAGALALAASAVLDGDAAIGPAAPATSAGTEPYSDARLAALRAARTPVFAYFTADWCITCKVNERVALDRADVRAAFKARGVAVLVGDWTRRDAALGAVLQRYGRAGVPLYLYFPAGATTPEILPQVLSPSLVIDAINR